MSQCGENSESMVRVYSDTSDDSIIIDRTVPVTFDKLHLTKDRETLIQLTARIFEKNDTIFDPDEDSGWVWQPIYVRDVDPTKHYACIVEVEEWKVKIWYRIRPEPVS
jgi:hypothetical protein